MKRRNYLLILYLLTTGYVPAAALAQDDPDSEESEPLVPDVFLSEPIVSKVELGIGYVSDDAYKFGRYNGMYKDSMFLLGDIKVKQYYEDGSFLNVRGTDLGLDSRYLRMETGDQGSLSIFIEYNELPNYKNNTVRTPFAGIASDTLTLPAGFDINTNLDASLNSFELQTQRQRIAAGVSIIPVQHWQFDIGFNHESKEGVDATGSAIANGTMQIIGNTTLALLPEPIDYDTETLNATLSYGGDTGQIDLAYYMSLFDNNNDSLSWQDPFNPTLASGSMSLEPDNEFHRLSLTGGYSLSDSARLTALASVGRMTQNQSFLPYTINTAVTTLPLPRTSLDGEVWLTDAQLKLSLSPLPKLRLSAELRYDERDNQTPTNTYSYVVLDSHPGGLIQNRPYSYKRDTIKLDANYRYSALASLRARYTRDEMQRSYINAEREDTDENTFYIKWKIKPRSNIDIALYAEDASRKGGAYNSLVNENPAMRKYHLADRDRKQLGAKVDFMTTDKLYLSARADYNKDDYDNSQIGLTEAVNPVYSLDFSYQPRHNITTYGYYTHENIRSNQVGFDASMTTTNWKVDSDDIFDTIGVGAKLTGLGRWDLGIDLVYNRSVAEIEILNLSSPGTETQFPDNKTALTSAKVWTSYNYSKHLSYKLGFRYEDYSVDNWAIDGLMPYDPAVVSNALLLGNETLDYNVYVVTVSASYKFQ